MHFKGRKGISRVYCGETHIAQCMNNHGGGGGGALFLSSQVSCTHNHPPPLTASNKNPLHNITEMLQFLQVPSTVSVRYMAKKFSKWAIFMMTARGTMHLHWSTIKIEHLKIEDIFQQKQARPVLSSALTCTHIIDRQGSGLEGNFVRINVVF